jgi:hypothetical protein
MNQQIVQQAFDTFEKRPDVASAIGASRVSAGQNIAFARECFDMSTSSAQEGAKALAEVVETIWGSTKLLHMRMLQNMAVHANVLFMAAHAITQAKSVPEVVQLQSELCLQGLMTTSDQAKEFVDLSARAGQLVIETTLNAATRPMNIPLGVNGPSEALPPLQGSPC